MGPAGGSRAAARRDDALGDGEHPHGDPGAAVRRPPLHRKDGVGVRPRHHGRRPTSRSRRTARTSTCCTASGCGPSAWSTTGASGCGSAPRSPPRVRAMRTTTSWSPTASRPGTPSASQARPAPRPVPAAARHQAGLFPRLLGACHARQTAWFPIREGAVQARRHPSRGASGPMAAGPTRYAHDPAVCPRPLGCSSRRALGSRSSCSTRRSRCRSSRSTRRATSTCRDRDTAKPAREGRTARARDRLGRDLRRRRRGLPRWGVQPQRGTPRR